MFQNLTGWHALIILAIVLLVFGAAKLPALAKSVGQSMRILRSEATEPVDDRAPSVAGQSEPVATTVSDAGRDAGPGPDRRVLRPAE